MVQGKEEAPDALGEEDEGKAEGEKATHLQHCLMLSG